jgi:hypothetical protein
MLCSYEKGHHSPSVPTLIRVLAARDCSVEEFGIHLVSPIILNFPRAIS